MDGNGRWAKNKGYVKRTIGHKSGAKNVRTITTHCAKLGISNLFLYAFSTENWKRPAQEVDFLLRMLQNYLEKEEETYTKNNIRFCTIGDLSKFSKPLQEQISKLENATKGNTGLKQILALNYGSQDEILRMTKKLEKKEKTIENIRSSLDTDIEIDMLIRTGGEFRLSNFLLFQSAYAELFFTPTFWPDFSTTELDKMLNTFKERKRRFGGLDE